MKRPTAMGNSMSRAQRPSKIHIIPKYEINHYSFLRTFSPTTPNWALCILGRTQKRHSFVHSDLCMCVDILLFVSLLTTTNIFELVYFHLSKPIVIFNLLESAPSIGQTMCRMKRKVRWIIKFWSWISIQFSG